MGFTSYQAGLQYKVSCILNLYLCSGHDTDKDNKTKYRPAFMDHFQIDSKGDTPRPPSSIGSTSSSQQTPSPQQTQQPHGAAPNAQKPAAQSSPSSSSQGITHSHTPFQRSFIDGDFEFVSFLFVFVCLFLTSLLNI